MPVRGGGVEVAEAAHDVDRKVGAWNRSTSTSSSSAPACPGSTWRAASPAPCRTTPSRSSGAGRDRRDLGSLSLPGSPLGLGHVHPVLSLPPVDARGRDQRGRCHPDYIRETATEFGIAERVRFDQRVVGASWSSITARWTVRVETSRARLGTCRFLHLATGYYDYDRGHVVDFPGRRPSRGDRPSAVLARGPRVAGRRVVVIGSGATAVTIVPALAGAGAQVVMLQRSPSYLASRPGTDALARTAFRVLPTRSRTVCSARRTSPSRRRATC